MVPEAPLEQTEHGQVARGPGWFVLNARDAPWFDRPGRGAFAEFEGAETDFAQLGINITVLAPGEPMAMYHWERDQEDFLVLAGEAILVVEGVERTIGPWDFVHCPPGTDHVIVGGGEAPCVVLAVGARVHSTGPDWGGYTVSELAQRHGASVAEATDDPEQAYARFGPSQLTGYREGWLPGNVPEA